jgi:hypothetical protein
MRVPETELAAENEVSIRGFFRSIEIQKEPSETRAGRGKQPRWLTSQLKSGKKLEDFRIQASSDRKRRSGRR